VKINIVLDSKYTFCHPLGSFTAKVLLEKKRFSSRCWEKQIASVKFQLKDASQRWLERDPDRL
jgi:hypothetical protein